jgi:hypothetical protein
MKIQKLIVLMAVCCTGVLIFATGPIFAATPQIAAGGLHTVGLKTDGTVVAAGLNLQGQCDVGGWTEI